MPSTSDESRLFGRLSLLYSAPVSTGRLRISRIAKVYCVPSENLGGGAACLSVPEMGLKELAESEKYEILFNWFLVDLQGKHPDRGNLSQWGKQTKCWVQIHFQDSNHSIKCDIKGELSRWLWLLSSNVLKLNSSNSNKIVDKIVGHRIPNGKKARYVGSKSWLTLPGWWARGWWTSQWAACTWAPRPGPSPSGSWSRRNKLDILILTTH